MTQRLFSERLRAARIAADLEVKDLARAVGMTSRQAANRWEDGTRMPDAETLVKIARVVHRSIDWLLGTDDLEGAEGPLTPQELVAVLTAEGGALWKGRPLDREARMRAAAALHALFAPLHELSPLGESGEQGEFDQQSNEDGHRATLVARSPRRRPPQERPDGDGQRQVRGSALEPGHDDC